MAFFLFFACKALLDLSALPADSASAAYSGFSVAASLSFTHGDSAEEPMLPFLAYSLYKNAQWSEEMDQSLPAQT